ncbi:unnamed protein product [Auanema sp. JU1783]|nr:unnamed protein product [Auanema sp. JU1783]
MDKGKSFGFNGRQSLLAQSNLKTPTRQRFSAAQTAESKKEGRFSLSGVNGGNGNRRLSLFKTQTAAPRVDTSDKLKQQGYIRKIVEYITDLEGEGIATPANVARPTMTDFIKFVNLIYEDLSPDYTLEGKKIVEEVPRFFAALGYPYPIKHSYLQPIGAAHNWHYLLHALCWMIDLNKLVESVHSVEGIILSNDATDCNTAAIRYSWFQSMFGEHLASKGDESVTRGAISRLKDFFENQENYRERLDMMMEEWNNLKKENNEYDNEKEDGLDLEQEIGNLIEDVHKAKRSCDNLKNDYENLERVVASVKHSVDGVKSEASELLKCLQDKKEELMLIEKKTGINTEEVLRMKTEMETNNQVHKQMREELGRCGAEIYGFQSQYAQGFSQLLSRLTDFIWKLNDFQRKTSENMDEIDIAPNSLEELQHFVTKELRGIITRVYISMDDMKNKRIADIETIKSQIATLEAQLEEENEKEADVRRILKRKQINKERCIEDRAKERQYIYSKIVECENEKETLENIFRNATGVCLKLEDSSRELERMKECARVFKLTFEDTMITNTQKVTSVLEAQQEVTNTCEKRMWDICEYFNQIMKSLSYGEPL